MAAAGCAVADQRECPVSGQQAAMFIRERGIALVVVLWLVALLALMAVSQTAGVRTDSQIVGNLIDSANARAAAYAGVQFAIADLAKPIPARAMTSDASFYAMRFGSARLTISISDESGKVDLNAAPGPLLDALLKASGVEAEQSNALVDGILDWRDKDELRRLNGAEEENYRAAGLEYGPRNGPFQSLEELALVIGLTAPIYHRLAPNITIYSGSPGVNTAVAPPAVLDALSGINNEEGDRISSTGDAASVVESAAMPRRGSVGGGRIFSIYVEALLDSGVRERLEAVVRLLPSRANAPLRYEYLRWREAVAPKLPHGISG